MKIGVFTVLFSQRPFEEALDYVKAAGCEAVEIGGRRLSRRRPRQAGGAARRRRGAASGSRTPSPPAAWRSAPSPATATRSTRSGDRRGARSRLPQHGPARPEARRADGDHLLRLPGRRSGGHGAELGDLPLAARLHRDAGVAVEGAGHALLGGGGKLTPRTTASGSPSSCTPASSPTTPSRSTGCARSAARRSASTSTPRTSSGRGWTRWSASATWATPSSTSTPRTPGSTSRTSAINGVLDTKPLHRRDPPLLDLPHRRLRPRPGVLALPDQRAAPGRLRRRHLHRARRLADERQRRLHQRRRVPQGRRHPRAGRPGVVGLDGVDESETVRRQKEIGLSSGSRQRDGYRDLIAWQKAMALGQRLVPVVTQLAGR